jgi:hypothetical protein
VINDGNKDGTGSEKGETGPSSLISSLSSNHSYLPGGMNPSPPVHHQPLSNSLDPQKVEVLKQQKAIWEEGIDL